jgi:glycosyltransferase involved in cell wall biosynthesis
MRILYFAEWFWPEIGGMSVMSAQLVTALKERGNSVVVIAEDDFGNLAPIDSYAGIPVHRFGLISALHDRDIERLTTVRGAISALCRSTGPDVIHAAYSPMGAYHVNVLARTGAPVLLSFHGGNGVMESADEGSLLARTLASAAWITACSEATLRDVRDVDPSVTARSSVVYNGVEAPSEPVVPLPTRPVVAAFGRMYHQKGFDVLLDAFKQVAHAADDVRLLLVGDGPERAALQRQAADLGIADNVSFRGWIPPTDVAAVIDDSTLVVVPSREEGFGLTALEAAMRGRAVIATRVGGLPEVVEEGNTGLLVAPERPDQMTDAILALLRDPTRLVLLGSAARSRAERAFSVDDYISAHERLYQRLARSMP